MTEVDGPAISGATVSVGGTSIAAVTDSNGAYEITIAAPGTYDLTASASGFFSKTQFNVSVDVNSITWADFALDSDGSTPDPLMISNVRSEKSGKGGSFKILWTTTKEATSQVEFTCCGVFTNSELVTAHSMSFRGSKGVLYEYWVTSTDAGGISVTAGPFPHQN